jgi:cobalt-zinc-cadmium efflux system outer membrane protein
VRRSVVDFLLLAGILLLTTSRAEAQGPNIPTETRLAAPGLRPAARRAPGALRGASGMTPDSQDEVLGGRPGPSVPRVPQSTTRPGQGADVMPLQDTISGPSALPLAQVPLFGPLMIPEGPEDEGPPDGLTLDAAIERLVHENLTLRALAHEIPQAQADILTASLRANPLLYYDTQLIPYGSYSGKPNGGPTQYDLNITYPLDVTGKRIARTRVATQAKRVLEAQYQDAVRLQIDNLYTAFTDILAARETIRFAEVARRGLKALLERTRGLYQKGSRTIADVSRIEALYEAAEVEVMDAEESLLSTRRTLGVLLNIPGPQAETMQIRASIRDTAPAPPPVDELIRTALECRPDVVAYRLGIARAKEEVKLARANRLSDVYLLYQPFTYQDARPFNTPSTTSWALGVTVPLPLYNRNQGNILRAKINVDRSHVEQAERQQQAMNEVRQAERQYILTRAALSRIEDRLRPAADRVLNDARRLYEQGEQDAIVYLNAQREYNEAARQYRDMLVRHRRAMLRLNTAVGVRLLP